MPENEVSNGPSLKRERSPSFPYLSLDACIDHLQKLYGAAKMNEVRQPDVAAAWGMAPKSGSLMRYVAALGQFGLIEAIGGGDQRRIKISADGRRILDDGRPGVRESLLSDAALKSSLIRGLYFGEGDMPKWGADRPSDSIAESSLKFDLGFGGEAARRFLTVYDATIKHIIDTDAANDGVDIDGSEALEYGRREPEKKANIMHAQPQYQAPKGPQEHIEGALNNIDYQNAGKGKIKISAVLDAEGLDMLEKKIAAFRMLIN
ncbi:MAG: hypothetical protein ACK4LQ_11075 [Pararhodobacter sp.]